MKIKKEKEIKWPFLRDILISVEVLNILSKMLELLNQSINPWTWIAIL